MNTVERARGRWREILPLMGVSARYLVNKHGPCPLCQGKDRYRFDDRTGNGDYFCNQCGAGNGLVMVKKLKGWSHQEACEEIDKIIGREAPRTQHYVQQAQSDETRRRDALRRLLDEAREPSVVEAYLERRGLKSLPAPPEQLVGHPACPYYDEESGRLLGRYPAVLAPIHGPNGELVSVQRIYDADVRPRKKTMRPVGTINGAAVRLFPYEDELGVTEGVENAIAAWLLFGVPTWAALSTNGLETFVVPAGVTTLHIFADNDENYEGQAAAALLARRVNRDTRNRKKGSPKPAIEVKVNIPDVPGTDWLDVYNAGRG